MTPGWLLQFTVPSSIEASTFEPEVSTTINTFKLPELLRLHPLPVAGLVGVLPAAGVFPEEGPASDDGLDEPKDSQLVGVQAVRMKPSTITAAKAESELRPLIIFPPIIFSYRHEYRLVTVNQSNRHSIPRQRRGLLQQIRDYDLDGRWLVEDLGANFGASHFEKPRPQDRHARLGLSYQNDFFSLYCLWSPQREREFISHDHFRLRLGIVISQFDLPILVMKRISMFHSVGSAAESKIGVLN